MPARPTFTIDLKEGFPHLPGAPIVEAVIHWRARSEKRLNQDELRQQLVRKLHDYPTVKIQHELHVESALGPDGAAVSRRDEWHGFRMETEDGRYIAQFTRNGFVFSRITPYEDWHRFAAEARRLWQIHVDLAEPVEIERLGVRFINRIVPVDVATLGEVLTLPPRAPAGMSLPIGEFLHRTLFDVPGHPYRVHVIQTSQPSAPPEPEGLSLILDIDVFTTQATQFDDNALETRLSEMRWLKNKAFYSLLTEETIKLLEEVRP